MVHLGIQPSEFDNLTLGERDAIVREANKKNRRK